MAEDKKEPSMLDQLLGYTEKLGTVYQKVELARKGVSTTPQVVYETNGINSPLVAQGQPAAVVGNDPFAKAISDLSGNAAKAYSAKQFSDSMPYVVGGLAFAVAIYLLVRAK